jgi:hypothetical protein
VSDAIKKKEKKASADYCPFEYPWVSSLPAVSRESEGGAIFTLRLHLVTPTSNSGLMPPGSQTGRAILGISVHALRPFTSLCPFTHINALPLSLPSSRAMIPYLTLPLCRTHLWPRVSGPTTVSHFLISRLPIAQTQTGSSSPLA